VKTHGFDIVRRLVLAGAGAVAVTALAPHAAFAASAAGLNDDATAALNQLYDTSPRARALTDRSLAVLVFPKITKAGFVVGAMSGNGVLFIHGQPARYYNISAASYGLQAGVQTFSFAMFFVTQSALDYLDRSNGWQVGVGPSVVVVDQGMAKTINTTTLSQDVYTMTFGQRGLMAGFGLEGSKITQIQPDQ
jgi:lipid-binding SYLF domain-containing protein